MLQRYVGVLLDYLFFFVQQVGDACHEYRWILLLLVK